MPARPDLTKLPCHYLHFGADRPLRLDSGAELSPLRLAYTTAGTLNADRSNAILVCHALTGDQFMVDPQPITGKPGWWLDMIGPGKPVDTDRYFVICVNVIGGCMGSTGPMDINPATGEPYGMSFPVITIGDMVAAQMLVVDHYGIDQLLCAIGGSMGGMQVLELIVRFPERVFAAIPIATAAYHTAQNIAFHEVGRQAIKADPDWCDGKYLQAGKRPERGLAVARMAAHVTYLSEAALHRKFGRSLQDRARVTWGFEADFQVESYLRHQGSTFVDRFDANSYMFITRAMDYFDVEDEHGRDETGQNPSLSRALSKVRSRVCVVSFTSDWLFPTAESRAIVRGLLASHARVSFVEIRSDKGHDAFLLDEPELDKMIGGFLSASAEERRLGRPVAS